MRPTRLSQLLSNLVCNACQHRRANTSVILRADGTQPRSVILEVWNEGVIPKGLLPAIFEPLRAGKGKRRAGSTSLGLGLYISQQIVIAHGGTIRVESNEELGTRFVVELPRHSAELVEQTFQPEPGRGGWPVERSRFAAGVVLADGISSLITRRASFCYEQMR